MRSFTCAAASQPPPSLALGAFVVHYRGHKHVRLRNLLPRGKKTLFVQSRSRKKARHSVIPNSLSCIISESVFPFWKWPEKSDHFPSKSNYQKCIYNFNLETALENRLVFLLKQPVVKKGKLCAKLVRAPRMEKHIKKIENDIIIMRLQ